MHVSQKRLRISCWIAIAVVLAGIPPIWPIGYYTLVRLIVSVVAICAIVVRRDLDAPYTVGLAFIALLFNPIFPVHLGKLLWIPVDLGVAYFFWRLSEIPLTSEDEAE